MAGRIRVGDFDFFLSPDSINLSDGLIDSMHMHARCKMPCHATL